MIKFVGYNEVELFSKCRLLWRKPVVFVGAGLQAFRFLKDVFSFKNTEALVQKLIRSKQQGYISNQLIPS